MTCHNTRPCKDTGQSHNSNGKILAGKEFLSMEDMNSIYRLYHEAQEEVKSEEREKFFVSVAEAK